MNPWPSDSLISQNGRQALLLIRPPQLVARSVQYYKSLPIVK